MTRPQADSAAFADALGCAAVISPLLRIRHRGPLPQLTRDLVFSSANGVAAYVALGGPRDLSAWCVGARTAQAAEQAGLQVQGVAQTAEALVAMDITARALTHLHGTHTRGDIAARLGARGLNCAAAAIYDQVALPLNAAAHALLASGHRVVIPLFSPRTAALFVKECPPTAWARVNVVAISPAVLDIVRPHARGIALAAQPDGASMRIAVHEALARG